MVVVGKEGVAVGLVRQGSFLFGKVFVGKTRADIQSKEDFGRMGLERAS